MGFAGVYRAVYSYSSASEQELSLQENDLLYLLETADDGWWTVKKRVPGAASEEPEGIVPHNYIEPANPEGESVRALYSYERQTNEELSFQEGALFDVYATDGDWVLVGIKGGNEFGFVPNNYIEKASAASTPAAPAAPAAASVAAPYNSTQQTRTVQSPALPDDDMAARPQLPQRTGEIATDENAPPRPSRPGQQRPPRDMLDRELPDEPQGRTDEPNHSKWPITDISGRRRVAKTLVVAPTFVTLINDDGGGRTQKWDVHDIISYSSEKKHVFLDLENPTVSLEMKASSQSEADHIVASLGQIVGAGRGGGLEEVLAAAKSAGHKQGQIVLDFKAANSRELSVNEFENVFVINDTDKDWWLVRNMSGKEGLVPRKFVHIDKKDGKISDFFRNKKQKDRHRDRELEREHESARTMARSLSREKSTRSEQSRDHRLSRKRSTHNDRQLPDQRKMRLWVDRSGSFKVDAQLLGCSDGKVHLHKSNGVKIAVPVNKLSVSDVEYVEGVTGVNLSDDKPLVDRVSRRQSQRKSKTDADVEETNSRNDFWLSFFLGCGIDPQNANRYAKNFTRDNMNESTLGDVNSSILRTLGLREGDILRVTKKINEKFGRVQNPEGGLYSNEGGALQNNTGTTPANVESQVWNDTPKAPEVTQPSLQPQPTAARVAPPQLTQEPTGALADLLGVSQPVKPSSTGSVTPHLTGAPTGQPLAGAVTGTGTPAALQAQKTAEAQLAAQQRQTQHQILRQQADLQKEQIRLLREQQDQLRRQQEELVQIQKTGSQLQALGPFATGVAQQSTFVPNAASVLSAAPQPPQPRMFQPIQQQPIQTGLTQQYTNGMAQQPTGPFAQSQTGFVPQTTGPFAQQRTGPFVPSQPTGPFANANMTGTQMQSQATGPFATAPTTPQSLPSQPTGPFANTTGMPQLTGGFQQPAQQQSAPLTSFGTNSTGPQANMIGQLSGLQLTGNPTGPFSQQPTSSQPTAASMFGQQTLLQQQPFQQRQQPTGPFQQPSVQPSAQPVSQPTTTFGNQFQMGQRTGPSSQLGTGNMMSSFPNSTGLGTGAIPQASSFPTQNLSQSSSMLPFQQQQPQPQPAGQFGQSNTSFFQNQATGPFQNQATGPFQNQATGPFQMQQPMMNQQTVGQTGFPQTSFGQQAGTPNPMGQVPLQSQATGFGFGNQPQQQQQQPMQNQRANFNMASANNPFGL